MDAQILKRSLTELQRAIADRAEESRTGRWKCAACGTRVNGESVDRADGPHQVCKGYCFNESECPGRACPGCGRKHYWTAAK